MTWHPFRWWRHRRQRREAEASRAYQASVECLAALRRVDAAFVALGAPRVRAIVVPPAIDLAHAPPAVVISTCRSTRVH